MLKLKSIDNIELLKSDVPLYYIKNYHGKACFSQDEKCELTLSIHFVLEMEPTGFKKINVQINEPVDYPLLPIMKMLKDEIKRLDEEAMLL